MQQTSFAGREPQVGIVGTFDVENFGDLLFPILAEAALTARLGRVKLHRFSYHRRQLPTWPFEVTSVSELPAIAPQLDALLVGGGFIVRFDAEVAPGYGPPDPAIHHPTGYWLTPALIALQHGAPLIWNAPGMHCNDVPDWARPLVALALRESAYVAVRDEPTRDTLKPLAEPQNVAVVPDTAFGLAGVLAARGASAEVARLRRALGLQGPYIVVQAMPILMPFFHWLARHREALAATGVRVVLVPIGPALGETDLVVGDADGLPDLVRLPSWPSPLDLAEIIAGAEAVVGHSYHLAITAITHGVPVFSSADPAAGKYTALAASGMHPLPAADAPLAWFTSRLGRRPPAAAATAALAEVETHWDHVARAIRAGRSASGSAAVGRLLQELPGLMAQSRRDRQVKIVAARAERVSLQAELTTARTELAAARAERDHLQQQVVALHASRSWNSTAPLRVLGRAWAQLAGLWRR